MQKDMPWYVYILRCNDNSLYTGITKDVQKRFLNHKHGKGAKYTKSNTPISIEYIKRYSGYSEAAKREREIKNLSKLKKEEIILEFRKD